MLHGADISNATRAALFLSAPVRCSLLALGTGSRLVTCAVAHQLTLMWCARVQSVVSLDPKLDACVAQPILSTLRMAAGAVCHPPACGAGLSHTMCADFVRLQSRPMKSSVSPR